jgi:hypothetical protein
MHAVGQAFQGTKAPTLAATIVDREIKPKGAVAVERPFVREAVLQTNIGEMNRSNGDNIGTVGRCAVFAFPEIIMVAHPDAVHLSAVGQFNVPDLLIKDSVLGTVSDFISNGVDTYLCHLSGDRFTFHKMNGILSAGAERETEEAQGTYDTKHAGLTVKVY